MFLLVNDHGMDENDEEGKPNDRRRVIALSDIRDITEYEGRAYIERAAGADLETVETFDAVLAALRAVSTVQAV